MTYYMRCQSVKDLMGSKLSNKRVIAAVEIKRMRDSFLTAVFLSEMPGKRNGKPFTGVQRHAKKAKKTPPDESGTPGVSSDFDLDQSPSASRLKMKPEDNSDSASECFDEETACEGEGYRLIDLKKLSSALSEAYVCNKGHLTVKRNPSGRNGLMVDLSVECSTCLNATPLKTSSFVTKRGQSFDVNQRAIYHSLETGGGYEGLVTFYSIMNMPCLSEPAYYKHVDTILEALEAEAEDEMRAAGQRVRAARNAAAANLQRRGPQGG